MRDLRRVVAHFVQQFSSWDDGSDNLGGWELKVGNQVPIFFSCLLIGYITIYFFSVAILL